MSYKLYDKFYFVNVKSLNLKYFQIKFFSILQLVIVFLDVDLDHNQNLFRVVLLNALIYCCLKIKNNNTIETLLSVVYLRDVVILYHPQNVLL